MKKEIKVQLENAGVNVEEVMGRLIGNMNLIARFFKRFPDDKSYMELVNSVEKGDVEQAFRAAHTLKGVCANLAMTRLYELISKQVEYFRAGDMKSGAKLMPEVTQEYENLVAVIRSIEWE